MQVDPSICAATYIGEKERRRGGRHQQTVHCKTGAAISQNLEGFFFKLPPKNKQEMTFTMLIYAPGCSSVL